MFETIIEHSLNKFLLSILNKPDTVLDAKISAVTKTGNIPALIELTCDVGGRVEII